MQHVSVAANCRECVVQVYRGKLLSNVTDMNVQQFSPTLGGFVRPDAVQDFGGRHGLSAAYVEALKDCEFALSETHGIAVVPRPQADGDPTGCAMPFEPWPAAARRCDRPSDRGRGRSWEGGGRPLPLVSSPRKAQRTRDFESRLGARAHLPALTGYRKNTWLVLIVLGCSDPVAPDFGRCDTPTTGAWTHLGLEGQWVTALAETPWGLFAGTGNNGVFRCGEAGKWERLGLDHAAVGAMLFVPGATPRLLVGMRPRAEEKTAAAVFATEDRGRTWLPWDGGLAAQYDNRQWAYSLAMDPGDPERLFMGQSAAILRSTDGGENWIYVHGSAGLSGIGMNAIVISPARDGRVWAGGEGALFNGLILLSEDWGDNWEPVIITPGFENAVFDLAVDQNDPRRIWAGVRGGVARSEDHGRTWEPVLTRISGDNGGTIANVLTLGADVYAVGSAFRPIPDTLRDLALFRSGDGGTTWTAVPAPPNLSGANVAMLDSNGHLLLGTGSELPGGVWRFQPWP